MGLWANMTEAERVAHSIRNNNEYHKKASKAQYLEDAQSINEERAAAAAPTTTNRTGENVVGSDGLTNRERYDARRAAEAAKHAAEVARIAELDSDRPPNVSRYLWERIREGKTNFNSTLVTRNADTRDALMAAGYGDYVKALAESEMDGAAAHFMGNGATRQDAYNTAMSPWYRETFGEYNNSTVQGNEPTLTFGGSTGAPTNEGYVAPVVSQPVVSDPAVSADPVDFSPTYTAKAGASDGMLGSYNARMPTAAPVNTIQATSNTAPTPYADAYLRAKEAAVAQGPVSGMMKKWME